MLTSPRRANNDPSKYGMLLHRLLPALLVLAVSSNAAVASAQAITGLGEDATLAPAGSIRLDIRSNWTYSDERYVSPSGSTGNGVLQSLGAPFTLDALGAAQLPILKPLEDTLRSLSGVPGVSVSLGATRARITNRVTNIPITVEAGVSHWLSLSAVVPIIHTRSNIFFGSNPTGTPGNLGANPALGDLNALAADTAFAQQVLRAATAVQAYCAGSGAGNAQCANATALVNDATGFGKTLGSLYADGALVPTATSTLQSAVNSRAEYYRTSLNAFAGIAGSGVPTVDAAGVVAAPTPLTTSQIQDVITNPAYGVELDPLQTVDRTHIGDLEFAAKVLLFDSFGLRGTDRFTPRGLNARFAVGAGYRFPTGEAASPDNVADIDLGTHQSALLLSGYADLMFGGHFWTSVVAHYSRPTSSNVILRLAPDSVVFPSLSSRQTVERQAGNLIEIAATPRWVFSDFISIGGQYVYRHKPADNYTLNGSPANGAITMLSPLVASTGMEFTEQRVGGGVVFSNAHAVQLGRSNFPFDVSYMHSQTVTGRGIVPKVISDQVMVRLYFRVRH